MRNTCEKTYVREALVHTPEVREMRYVYVVGYTLWIEDLMKQSYEALEYLMKLSHEVEVQLY